MITFTTRCMLSDDAKQVFSQLVTPIHLCSSLLLNNCQCLHEISGLFLRYIPGGRGVGHDVPSDRLHLRSSIHWHRIHRSHDLVGQYHCHIELPTPDKKSQTTISHTPPVVTRCQHSNIFRKYTSPSRHQFVKQVNWTHQLDNVIRRYVSIIKIIFCETYVGIPHLPSLGAFSRRLPDEAVALPAPLAQRSRCETKLCSCPPPSKQTCRSQRSTPNVSVSCHR